MIAYRLSHKAVKGYLQEVMQQGKNTTIVSFRLFLESAGETPGLTNQ